MLGRKIANLKAASTVPIDGQTSARVQDLCARIAAQTASTEEMPEDDAPTRVRPR